MNTVINQLVKEAAYHAAKYDSTINAIRAIAKSQQTTKTAGWEDFGSAMSAIGNLGPEIKDALIGGASDLVDALPEYAESLGSNIPAALRGNNSSEILDTLKGLGQTLGDTTMNLPQGVGIGLMGAAGGGALAANSMMNAAKKDIAANAAEYAKQLAAQNSASNSAINALKDQLGAANAQNADLFANASARFQNAGNDALAKLKGLGGSIADMGAAAKNKLMGLGGDIVNAAKAHPYAAAGLGLAGAGAAALPFLLGGEKEGSYDPYKLQVLRSVLSGM